jgi:hypothetical protein
LVREQSPFQEAFLEIGSGQIAYQLTHQSIFVAQSSMRKGMMAYWLITPLPAASTRLLDKLDQIP